MVSVLHDTQSVANQFIAELRDSKIQQDRMRFRTNLERLGMLMGYELSKVLDYQATEVETPLGMVSTTRISQPLVLGTILRAGLPLHQGLLNVFDQAENAFVSAYRRHHKSGKFDIEIEYVSCPDLTDKTLILADPMLATGSSIVLTVEALKRFGVPAQVHIVTAIAAEAGIEHVQRELPDAHIWAAVVDAELTAKGYIVPGLGDAGDLSFGSKTQQ